MMTPTLRLLVSSIAANSIMPVSTAAEPRSIDPASVSPQMYEVLLENEHVRVVRYRIAPGERDRWHTHPAKVSVVVAGGSLRITTADGDSFDVREETGTVSWMAPLGRHFGENIGDTPVEIVLVEVKSAADADPAPD